MKVYLIEKDAFVPSYATEGAAGMDLASCHDCYVHPGSRQVIRTGVKVAINPGFEGQVRPRSGLAAKNGITVLNTPGTIDSDYRGELLVILHNTSSEVFRVKKGMRIAQLVIAPVHKVVPVVVDKLDETVRGAGGLGSTGV